MCYTETCAAMKTNITLKIEADLLREARVLAALEGSSISALLAANWNRQSASARDTARRAEVPWRGCGRASTCNGRPLAHEMNCMSDKCFVDTNILVYAHDRSTGIKHERARSSDRRALELGQGRAEYAGSARALHQPSPQGRESYAGGGSSQIDSRILDLGGRHEYSRIGARGAGD